MFSHRYFPTGFYGPRYWPKVVPPVFGGYLLAVFNKLMHATINN